ncbi:phosphotriesterase family protein [Kitasatospora kifunensis]|uniref:Phosphotriesterase-related protein n=1 Tax=Kitasatospora kifunensis TaxID=58351 RepID=A0A7W7R6V9_KITKI|nr:aryldialkylphosphatase [Kitasatospora kifunensis]MBB4926344.1 phosphotriesterase-related protein [Kitasatospora kifunensis]
MPYVQTVLGPVDPDRLGRVLSHEHLLALAPGPGLAQDPVELAVAALGGLAAYGVDTVVDLSPYGDAGRDPGGANVVLLQEIARRSGVHIIAGTATYRAEFSPPWVRAATGEELTRRFVADAQTGIGSTEVRAGILGEQPTGLDTVSTHEETGLRAAALAHHATGLALNTHTTHGTMALEQLAILDQEDVARERVVIGHLDNHPELDYVRRVLDTGVTIAFDSIGKQDWDLRTPPPTEPRPNGEYAKRALHQSDLTRAHRLARLVADGYAEQIVLSQDLTGGQMYLNPTTHGRWGYAYLPTVFLGLLTELGVGEQQIETMMRTNPVRLLTLD